MTIHYFSIKGAPGKYFTCGAYRASMSQSGCASLYRAEKGVHAGLHPHCKGCAVGAIHAGERPLAAPGLLGSLICPRCQRGSTRLVRGICVSCVNRQYELARGFNARGSALVRVRPLAHMAMSVREDGQTVVAEVALCSSRLELILRALRQRPGARAFGRRSSSARVINQLAGELFAARAIRL